MTTERARALTEFRRPDSAEWVNCYAQSIHTGYAQTRRHQNERRKEKGALNRRAKAGRGRVAGSHAMNRLNIFAIVAGVVLMAIGVMLGFQTTTVTIAGDSLACGSFFAGPSDQALSVTEAGGITIKPDAANTTSDTQVVRVDPVAACAPVLSDRNTLVWLTFGVGGALTAVGALKRRRPAQPQPVPATAAYQPAPGQPARRLPPLPHGWPPTNPPQDQ